MADDDDNKPKKHTLESLFRIYANTITNPTELDNVVYETILLSQIDIWLDQAKLFRTVFSRADTGLTYMKFKKWRLDFEEFLEFLELICVGKDIEFEKLKEQLVAAGLPGGGNEGVVIK